MGRIRAVATVGTSPDRAFSLLRETRSWPSWWRGLSHARTADLRPPREGSELELTFALGPLRLGSRGRIHMVTDDRALAWRSPVAGIPVAWTFFFSPTQRGTRVEVNADLPLPDVLLRWTGLQRWWTRAAERSLRRFKEMAERL